MAGLTQGAIAASGAGAARTDVPAAAAPGTTAAPPSSAPDGGGADGTAVAPGVPDLTSAVADPPPDPLPGGTLPAPAGLGPGPAPAAATGTTPGTTSGTAAGAEPSAGSEAAASSPAAPGCVPAPLEERAAAVLVVGLPGVTSADQDLAREVVELGVGGVFLSSSNVRTARQTTDLVTGLQAGMDVAHGRPLVVSTDEESGRVALARQVVGAGPSPRSLAASSTPAEVEQFAAASGTRLAELGVTLNLAPVVDLDEGPADGVIGDRAFGADPDVVTRYAAAYWRGLASAGVAPTVKHFPGHGRSVTDTHAEGDVVETSLGELLRTDLVPFARAVEDGVPVVMLNHLGYRALDPHLPASLSPAAYAALREMGFEGVAMTDSLGMGAVHQRWDFPESVVLAVQAGADAALTTDGSQARGMRDALVAAVRAGALPEDRLSEAAARVTALAGGDPVRMSCVDVELPAVRAEAAQQDAGRAPAAPGPDDGP